MGGEVQDTSKKSVLKAIEQADLLQEVEVGPCMGGSCMLEGAWGRGGPARPHLLSSVLAQPVPAGALSPPMPKSAAVRLGGSGRRPPHSLLLVLLMSHW